MRFGGFGFNQQFGFTAPAQDTVAATPSYAAWPSLIGAEMMVNGDCSSGTGWTLGSGCVIAADKMTMTAASSSGNRNTGVEFTAFVEGGTYRCGETADSVTLGNYQISVGTTAGTIRSAPGTYTQDLVAAGLDSEEGWLMTYNGATMQLDSFSVKSVGLLGVEADWSITGAAISWSANNGGFLQWDNPADTDIASLTGTAKTDFDAAVSANTACNFTFYSPGGEGSNMQFRARGGSWTNLVMDGSTGPFVVACTSGAGSGFDFRGVIGGSGGADGLNRVQVALA